MSRTETLLITGASVRAAAQSAIRAGLHPACADFFCDCDLQTICPSERMPISAVDDPFISFAERHAPACWFYTGSFENDPERVDRISTRHRLWGNPGSILRRVRDPFWLTQCLQLSGLLAPEVRRTSEGLPRDGSWLAKPLSSAGGVGVVRLTKECEAGGEAAYFQKRIQGRSHSALFVATPQKSCNLIGATRQFHGAGRQPFAYRGSLGPVPVGEGVVEYLDRIGRTLTAEFGLVGLFGVDFLVNREGWWVVEVNPRYTASVEIHELARRCALLSEHRRVCDSESPKRGVLTVDLSASPSKIVGKWVIYASRRLTAPELPIPADHVHNPFTVPDIADIPRPGTVIEVGEPVLTVFGEGTDPVGCALSLRYNVHRWRTLLGLTD